jgi:hypothetical protein
MWKEHAMQEVLLRELVAQAPASRGGSRQRWDVHVGPKTRYKSLMERDREPPVEDRIKVYEIPFESKTTEIG